MRQFYFSFYLFLCLAPLANAQLNVSSGATPADIQVCINSQTVDITLFATGNVVGNTIEIGLPPGVAYVPGSVTLLSSPGGIVITESNIANLQNPIFSFAGNMTIGQSCTFQITRTADCQTIAFRNAGNLLLDSVFVTYNTNAMANNLGNINTTVIPFGLNEALVSLSGNGPGGSIANLEGYPGD
ncbi:MAG: hypothetical protein MK212_22455, partial [Saprospiraceae bacterium]|nr:hypothetical protein [Saprospiraceae bacterium]